MQLPRSRVDQREETGQTGCFEFKSWASGVIKLVVVRMKRSTSIEQIWACGFRHIQTNSDSHIWKTSTDQGPQLKGPTVRASATDFLIAYVSQKSLYALGMTTHYSQPWHLIVNSACFTWNVSNTLRNVARCDWVQNLLVVKAFYASALPQDMRSTWALDYPGWFACENWNSRVLQNMAQVANSSLVWIFECIFLGH